jgi:hypothetical protein
MNILSSQDKFQKILVYKTKYRSMKTIFWGGGGKQSHETLFSVRNTNLFNYDNTTIALLNVSANSGMYKIGFLRIFRYSNY